MMLKKIKLCCSVLFMKLCCSVHEAVPFCAVHETVPFMKESHFHAEHPPKCSHNMFTHVFFATTNTKKVFFIAIGNSICFTLYDQRIDDNGRYIVLVCELNNVMYTIVNLYAPNQRQIYFVCNLLKKVQKISKGDLLIMCDFNCVVDRVADTSASGSASRYTLQPLLKMGKLYNAWRRLHPSEKD